MLKIKFSPDEIDVFASNLVRTVEVKVILSPTFIPV